LNTALGYLDGVETLLAGNLLATQYFLSDAVATPLRRGTHHVFLNAADCDPAAVIVNATANKKYRVLGGLLTASVAGNILIADNNGVDEVTMALIPVLAGAPVSFDLGNGVLARADGNVITALLTGGTVSGYIIYTVED